MFFCAALAIGLVKSGKVQAISMDRDTYVRCVRREGFGGVYQPKTALLQVAADMFACQGAGEQ